MRPSAIILCAALALAGLVAAPAGAATLRASYTISLAGLTLGTAELTSTIEGLSYRMEGQARMTGLVGAVTSGKGTAKASGSLAGPRPLPSAFTVSAASSSLERTLTMALASGNVAALEVTPPFEPRPDRVPLTDVHKRGIIDPLSGLLVPVPGSGSLTDPGACNRTIPIFDGTVRFNVVLTYAGTREVERGGYKGPVLVCEARYVPIAGHRPERPATKFMIENRDMSVWMAPVEGTRALLPVRIAVRTMLGLSVIEAASWKVDGARAQGAGRRPPS
jgi:hypothetical protein